MRPEASCCVTCVLLVARVSARVIISQLLSCLWSDANVTVTFVLASSIASELFVVVVVTGGSKSHQCN